METIKVVETALGTVILPKEIGLTLKELAKRSSGDGRRKEVREARIHFNEIYKSISDLQRAHLRATGESVLDLTK